MFAVDVKQQCNNNNNINVEMLTHICWHFNIDEREKNSILGLSEPKKAEFLDIFTNQVPLCSLLSVVTSGALYKSQTRESKFHISKKTAFFKIGEI